MRGKSIGTSAFVTGALGLAALGVIACGEGTAPAEPGTLQAVVRDDPTTLMAALPPGGLFFAHHKQFGNEYYHGTLGAELQVLVSGDQITWFDLGSPSRASVALQAEQAETMVHDGGPVPPGTYRYVRLAVADAAASVTAGSVFGGTELESDVQLTVGDGGAALIDLQLPAPLDVASGQTLTLVFDLNSEAWVSADGVSSGRADPGALAAAVSVGVRLPAALAVIAL